MRRQLVGAVSLALLLIGLPSNYDDLLRWRGWAHSMLGDHYAPTAFVSGLVLFLVWIFWERLFPKAKPIESEAAAATSIHSHQQAGGQTGYINVGGNLTLSQEPPRVEDPEEREYRRAIEQELVDIGHTFYKSVNRWYTAAVERRDTDAHLYRTETLAAMEAVCGVLKAKVSPSSENTFRNSQPAEPYYSERIPLIERGLEINAMTHRSTRLTEIAHRVRTGAESIVWPLSLGEYKGPAEFPLSRSMGDNLNDRRREREAAKDRFVLFMPNGNDKSYSRAEVDVLSYIQRRRLFDQDGAMEDWYRGLRMNDGSWAMTRFDDPGPGGPIWMTFPELRNLSEDDRSAVLIKYNGPIRRWYLRRLKEHGE